MGLNQAGGYSPYATSAYNSGGYVASYSSDPCVNAAIRTANATQYVQSLGVPTTSDNDYNKTSQKRQKRKSSSVYDCCSRVPSFGIVQYHKCKNCGVEHQIGTHSCIKNNQ